MIHQAKITNEWIQELAGKHKADPLLIEKVIRALLLLEGLVKQEVDFVFKGGTDLMLHFDSSRRLSIDIDIIFPGEDRNLDPVLDALIKEQGFTRYELQERGARSDIEKAHYKLYYAPAGEKAGEEEYVLLDVLYEQVHYTNLTALPIQSSFLPQEGNPLQVAIPSVEDLLGDKLTAFAPETTGIPYKKGDNSMSMEIIKQLYDVGCLFEVVDHLEVVEKTFQKFAMAELAYRNMQTLGPEAVLEDIYQTGLTIATRGKEGAADFEELQSGIRRIKGFIFSVNYTEEKAINHASKAAYLAQVLLRGVQELIRFDSGVEMRDWTIKAPLSTRLNKVKRSDPEAFFYWYQIFELLQND